MSTNYDIPKGVGNKVYKKYLLYFAISDKKYIDLLDLCIESITTYSSFIPEIVVLYSFLGTKLDNFTNGIYVTNKNIDTTYNLKLYTHLIPNIESYEKILYIDCDILCIRNLIDIYDDIIKEDTLYVMKEQDYDINHESFSIGYTPEELELLTSRNSIPFNSGVMGFKPSCIHNFQKCLELISCRKNTIGKNVVLLFDQPYINYIFQMKGNYDTIVSDKITITPEQYYSYPHFVLLHFAGWPGDNVKKIDRMNNIKILYKKYYDIITSKKGKIIDMMNIS